MALQVHTQILIYCSCEASPTPHHWSPPGRFHVTHAHAHRSPLTGLWSVGRVAFGRHEPSGLPERPSPAANGLLISNAFYSFENEPVQSKVPIRTYLKRCRSISPCQNAASQDGRRSLRLSRRSSGCSSSQYGLAALLGCCASIITWRIVKQHVNRVVRTQAGASTIP